MPEAEDISINQLRISNNYISLCCIWFAIFQIWMLLVSMHAFKIFFADEASNITIWTKIDEQ